MKQIRLIMLLYELTHKVRKNYICHRCTVKFSSYPKGNLNCPCSNSPNLSVYANSLPTIPRPDKYIEDISEPLLLTLSLLQGQWRAAEYALVYRTFTTEGGWKEPTLKAAYRSGLKADILKELARRNDTATLDSRIHLSICLNNLLKDRSDKDHRIP